MTVIVAVFLPISSASAPETSKVASGLSVTASNSADSVPSGRIKVDPTLTGAPFTKKVFKRLSLERATFMVTV